MEQRRRHLVLVTGIGLVTFAFSSLQIAITQVQPVLATVPKHRDWFETTFAHFPGLAARTTSSHIMEGTQIDKHPPKTNQQARLKKTITESQRNETNLTTLSE